MQLQVESFTIRNGQVPCQFEFITKPDEETYCKKWLTANPSKGFLLSGELLLLVCLMLMSWYCALLAQLPLHSWECCACLQAVGLILVVTESEFFYHFLADAEITVELEVFVNKSTATRLNSGEEKLEDILVLHLVRGKDYFLSITGNYLPSCFGSPIHTLCYMREPIQDMSAESIRRLVS